MLSLEEVREMSTPQLRKILWEPVVERIISEAGTSDPQGIADFFTRRLSLPSVLIEEFPEGMAEVDCIILLRHKIQGYMERNDLIGHRFENFNTETFNTDFPYAVMCGRVDIFGRKISKSSYQVQSRGRGTKRPSTDAGIGIVV